MATAADFQNQPQVDRDDLIRMIILRHMRLFYKPLLETTQSNESHKQEQSQQQHHYQQQHSSSQPAQQQATAEILCEDDGTTDKDLKYYYNQVINEINEMKRNNFWHSPAVSTCPRNQRDNRRPPRSSVRSRRHDERKHFVGELSRSTTRPYFSEFGAMESIPVKVDPHTDISRSYAIIDLSNPPKSIQELHASGKPYL